MLLLTYLITVLTAMISSTSAWSMDLFANDDCTGNYASYKGDDDYSECMTAGNPGEGCEWHEDGEDTASCTAPMSPQPLSFRFAKGTNCAVGTDAVHCGNQGLYSDYEDKCFKVENLYNVGEFVTFRCWDV